MNGRAYNNRTGYWIRRGVLLILLLTVLNFAKSYFLGMFFYPDNVKESHPSLQNLLFEELRFKSLDRRQLKGYFFKPSQRPKGTVIHCHGNAGNITGHYPLVLFLVQAGYNVFVFDYGGYGESEGNPSPEEIVGDAQAALAAVRARPDVDATRLALFGQSLGGAAAAGAMAKDPGVRCLILEGTFTTYREMAQATPLGKILFFLTPFVIPNIGPKVDLPKIAPRPVLILHGDEDKLIPVRFASELYKAASDKKGLTILKGFQHLQGEEGVPLYRDTILRFLKENLS